MRFLRDWAFKVCVCSILSGTFMHLLPKGKMKKCAEYALGLLMCVMFFLPFFNGEFRPDTESISIEALQTDQAKKEAEEYMKTYVCSELGTQLLRRGERRGLSAKKAGVEPDFSAAQEVKVKTVVLYGVPSNQKQAWRDLCRDLFTQQAVVIFEN